MSTTDEELNNNYIKAISDGGSMIDCTPTATANHLIAIGVCDKLYTEQQPFYNHFEKTDAKVHITHFIRGSGLIDKLAVAHEIQTTLISDSTFTSKGIIVFKSDTEVIGISSLGETIFKGKRDNTTKNSLWEIDLIQIMKAPHPNTCKKTQITSDVPSFFSGTKSKSPTYAFPEIKEGRSIQRALGNISFKTIGGISALLL